MDRFDIICIGVVLIDLPLGPLDERVFHEETTTVKQIGLTTGGDALNEAIILARLGKRPALIGQVGTDLLGDVIIRRCEEEGVDHSRLDRDRSTATRINVVVIGHDGQRHFIKTEGTGRTSLRADEIDFELIKHAKAVSLASIFCSKLRDPETIFKILKTAKDSGVVTFADMVPMTAGEQIGDIAEALPYLDYFLPNLEEAAMLTGRQDPDEMADFLLQYGIKNVVIKLGKEGCLIRNRQERHRIPAFPAETVDTTGAGDNFAAGFITAIMDGMSLAGCGRFACAVAAVSTESMGAASGVKNRKQIEDRMSRK